MMPNSVTNKSQLQQHTLSASVVNNTSNNSLSNSSLVPAAVNSSTGSDYEDAANNYSDIFSRALQQANIPDDCRMMSADELTAPPPPPVVVAADFESSILPQQQQPIKQLTASKPVSSNNIIVTNNISCVGGGNAGGSGIRSVTLETRRENVLATAPTASLLPTDNAVASVLPNSGV